MDDIESVDQGEESNDTSVVEESAPPAESSEAETQASGKTEDSAPEKQEEKPIPFHEHPRFKELIDQNRSMREQEALRGQVLESLQRELASLRESAKPKAEPVKDPFLAELEKIDPSYAKSLEGVYGKAARVDALEQRLAQYEQEQFREKAVTHFNQLLDSNKVSDPFDRKMYERAVRAEVYERESKGQKLGLKDLDKIVAEVHGEYSKAMEERNRKNLTSYVQDKTKDKAPRSTTGGGAVSPQPKKLKAGDIAGQAKWLAQEIKKLKSEQ